MEMTPDNWNKIKALFEAALAKQPSERAAFLAQNCPDESLRQAVEKLLLNHKEAGSFLSDPAISPQLSPAHRVMEAGNTEQSPGFEAGFGEPSPTVPGTEAEDPMTGRRLGAYQLARRIGQGGMAAVFLAERADGEFRRQVAIKVVLPGLGSEEVLKRFRNERQTLAGLDHPNIIKLLDGGSTPEGAPYLVMDYVEGSPIDEYCDNHKLSIQERLQLFGKVCEAVEYAHQKRVIHRDLKPSNILVTADGVPKLLDFGIAKVLEPAARALSVTETTTRCMTPAYASPEQVRGRTVTPATDVYALGVVLYELLTGHRPYRLKEHTPAEIERAICEQEPESPSTAVSRVESETSSEGTTVTRTPDLVSQTREGSPQKLGRRLRGDLDNILLKALRKEPERRYPSVQDLARDIDRHLTHLPVTARPPSLCYRASKLLQRHKAEVSAAIVLVLAVLAFQFTRPLPPPNIVGSTRLTHDGLPKNLAECTNPVPLRPMFTDGSRIYLTELGGGIAFPRQVPVEGGEVVSLPSLLRNTQLLDFSPQHSGLLMATSNQIGGSPDTPIWILPTLGASPWRLGDILAHDAAWSPDGERIVYARGFCLYVAKSDGSASQKLVSVPGFALWPRWSPDGSRLRFSLWDAKTRSSALWEVLADGSQLRPLLPGWNNPPGEYGGNWTPDGKYFVFQSQRNGRSDLWAMRAVHPFFRKSSPRPVQLTTGLLSFGVPLPSKDGKKVFAVGMQPRGELERFDARSGQFRPYLSGISADCVSSSRDGRWLAYTAFPEGTLWRSKVDGSEQLQLTYPPMQAGMPRWSPDGKQIAFMGAAPGKPWKIYLVVSEGGSVQQLTTGDLNDADPNWSADGNSLVFSGPPGIEPGRTFTISLLDLKTRQVRPLPGSDGFFSPRWSPDGRYIDATAGDAQKLMLFDFATHKWRELARAHENFHNWSRDGKYVYFDNAEFEQDVSIQRVRISDGKLEKVVSLDGFRLAAGDYFSPWTGLAPDDSPLVLRDTGIMEIYALDWEAP